MKTVTNNFLYLQKQPGTKIMTRVYYKRRLWDVATTTYIYETNWTELDRDDFSDMSSIAQQLDTKILSEFKVSNVTIKLKNELNQWDEDNTAGCFAVDAGSSFGYEPYLMKFKITSGFMDDDFSEELVTMFIGVATEFLFDARSRTVSVSVEGLQRKLDDADAEAVSTAVSLETIGTGDGVTKIFYTDNNGVSQIDTVTVNAVTMTKGTDYKISNLDDIDKPASIEIAIPVTNAYLVKCTYRYWKKNKTVDQLITDLVAAAGIASTSIDNATLGSISNNITFSSKDEFEDGTNTNADTTDEPGTIKVDYGTKTLWNDFSLGGGVSGNNWTALFTGDAYYWTVASNQLKGDSSGTTQAGALKRLFGYDIAFGTWLFNLKLDTAGEFFKIWFVANGDTQDAHDGYFIRNGGAGAVLDTLKFGYNEEGTTTETILYSISVGTQYTADTQVKIVRDMFGKFSIYIDDVFKFSVQDQKYVNGDRMILAGTATAQYFSYIYIPPDAITVTHLSKSFDTLSGLSAWGNLSVDYDLSQLDSITLKTKVSTDDSSWDALVAVSATNLIQSAVKRYLRVEIAVTADTNQLSTSVNVFLPNFLNVTDQENSLIVTKVRGYTVQFTSNRVFVAMANFSGKTCYQAIQELAKFSDFEWGIDDTETFFFRARNTNASVDLALSESNFLSEVQSLATEYDKLYSGLRVRFGEFISESNSVADIRTSALEILGNKNVLEISGQALINKDTNVADAIAAIYIARLSTKRKRLRVSTKYLPQIELSDTVSVTLKHNPNDTYHFLNALVCNVIGTNHDPKAARSVFELEEIL